MRPIAPPLLAPLLLLIAGLALGSLDSCSAPVEPPAYLSAKAQQGWQAYRRHCAICHSMDPHQEGVQGPPVAGASMELLKARVLHADYPAGHKPLRKTSIMYALPQAKDDLPAIHCFLEEAKPQK